MRKSRGGFLGDRILVCNSCGEAFEAGSDTKRCVCEKCWKEQEKERIRKAVIASRIRKKNVTGTR